MTETALLHATSVAIAGKGLLVMGPSGAGKSSLALQLIGLGAVLIADDQTEVYLKDGIPFLRCPPALIGLIEARCVGVMVAPSVRTAPLHLVVDLGRTESERLPAQHHVTLLGRRIDLVFGSEHAHFPMAVMLQLRHGRHA